MTPANKLMREILGLLLLSSILAIGAQSLLPNGIGVRTKTIIIQTDSSSIELPAVTVDPTDSVTEAGSISLQAAYAAYQDSAAIFLDARGLEDYVQGHIAGAISLPAHAFMDSVDLLDDYAADQMIITYCDGIECNASLDLAANLKLMDFSKIFYFFGGWQEWQTAGYPIESGQN